MPKKSKSMEQFYNSGAWQSIRKECMHRDAFLCQDCLRKGIITTAEEVHHIRPLTPENVGDPSVSLNLDNLISLCRQCHAKRHTSDDKRYKVDEFGRVTIID